MLPRNFFIDSRVFVSGARNPFLNVADSKWLNDIVSQIVLNTTPGQPQLPLIFQNALTRTYTQGVGSEIEWGGTLLHDTTVNGQSLYSTTFSNSGGFSVTTAINNISLKALTGLINITSATSNIAVDAFNILTLQGRSTLNIATPNSATAPTGSILLNQGTSALGTVLFSPYGLPLTDGTPGQILVTDGVGNVTWTSATGTITGADNGLSLVGTEVYLGGTLLQNTTVFGNANTYNMKFEGINVFGVTGLEVSLVGSTSASLTSTTQTTVQSAGLLELEGHTQFNLTTPNVFNTTAVNGQILQLIDDTNGEVEFTPYALPLTDGTSGNILSTNGSGIVSWGAPKAEVLYFTDNPLNTSYLDDGLGGRTVETYTIPGNTVTEDGSYFLIEASVDVSGVSGTNPQFQISVGGNVLCVFVHSPEHSYTQTIKGKIYKVSNTTYFSQFESNVYNTSGQLLTSYIGNGSGAITWASNNDAELIFDLGTGTHTSETEYFTITKISK